MLIDDYVARLDRALTGPAGPKRDMVVEARDGLVDAAEALEAGGLPREEAERLAVDEFGAVDEIAPGYQGELTACAGRRLGLTLLVAAPLTWLVWWSVWRVFPQDLSSWGRRPEWVGLVSQAMDGLQLFTGVLGGAMVLALRREGWTAHRVWLVTRVVAVYVKVLLPLTVALCVPLLYGARPAGGYAPWAVAGAATLLLMVVQMRHAGRCLRLTRLHTA